MTRPLRIVFPGATYHVMSRGDRRRDIFLDDTDRRVFLQLLAKEIRQQRWCLLAYCLMANHYHLLLETPEANLVAGMRRFNGVYTQALNRRHALVGHVFQGRYKAVLVDREAYLLELSRYIVLNPVRAGVVQAARDWPWSSFRATAGIAQAPDWLACHKVLQQFGVDALEACGTYAQFVAAGVDVPSPWSQLRGQIYLGGENFLADMERRAAAHPADGFARIQRQPARPTAEAVLRSISEAAGISVEVVRSRADKDAFQAWVYLLRRAANLTLCETARIVALSPGRVSQIQTELEARPANPVVARLMRDFASRDPAAPT